MDWWIVISIIFAIISSITLGALIWILKSSTTQATQSTQQKTPVPSETGKTTIAIKSLQTTPIPANTSIIVPPTTPTPTKKKRVGRNPIVKGMSLNTTITTVPETEAERLAALSNTASYLPSWYTSEQEQPLAEEAETSES